MLALEDYDFNWQDGWQETNHLTYTCVGVMSALFKEYWKGAPALRVFFQDEILWVCKVYDLLPIHFNLYPLYWPLLWLRPPFPLTWSQCLQAWFSTVVFLWLRLLRRLLGTCGCSLGLAVYLLMAYLFFLVIVIQYWRLWVVCLSIFFSNCYCSKWEIFKNQSFMHYRRSQGTWGCLQHLHLHSVHPAHLTEESQVQNMWPKSRHQHFAPPSGPTLAVPC